MLLGLEAEGVDVDTCGRDVRVVLVRLDQVEVLALALTEAIVAVQLDLGSDHGVLARGTLRQRITRVQRRAVPEVAVVEGLRALPGAHNRRVARHE